MKRARHPVTPVTRPYIASLSRVKEVQNHCTLHLLLELFTTRHKHAHILYVQESALDRPKLVCIGHLNVGLKITVTFI